MTISKKIGKYMKDRAYNLAEVARKTNLDYDSLYISLFDETRNRDLRTEELIPLCIFLNVDPREFARDEEKESA